MDSIITFLTMIVLLITAYRVVNGPQVVFSRVALVFFGLGLLLMSGDAAIGGFVSEFGPGLFLVGFALGCWMLLLDAKTIYLKSKKMEK